jgi:hypothetical protein
MPDVPPNKRLSGRLSR